MVLDYLELGSIGQIHFVEEYGGMNGKQEEGRSPQDAPRRPAESNVAACTGMKMEYKIKASGGNRLNH